MITNVCILIFHITGKRSPKLPETHLKTIGGFNSKTENTQNFLDPRGAVPVNNNQDMIVDDVLQQDESQEQHNKDEHIQMLVSKLEDLQAPPLETPEYKDAFKVTNKLFN